MLFLLFRDTGMLTAGPGTGTYLLQGFCLVDFHQVWMFSTCMTSTTRASRLAKTSQWRAGFHLLLSTSAGSSV